MISWPVIARFLILTLNVEGQAIIPQVEKQWSQDSVSKNWEGIYRATQKIRNSESTDQTKVHYYQRALKFYNSIHLNNDSVYGRTHIFIGLDVYEFDGADAVRNLKRGLSYYKKIFPSDDYRIHSTYFHIAEKLFLAQQIGESLTYFDSAQSIQWQNTREYNWSRTINLLARLYGFQGDLGKSQLCLLLNEPYYQKYDNEDRQYFINTKAGIYRDLNLPRDALRILQPILDNPASPYYSYSQAGQAYLDLHIPDSAIYFFEKQLQLSEGQSASEIAWIHHNLSRSYQLKGDYQEALASFHNIDLIDVGQSQMGIHFAHLAQILMMMGELDSALAIDRSVKNIFLRDGQITIFDRADFFASYVDLLFRTWKMSNEDHILIEAKQVIHQTDSLLQVMRYSLTSPSGRQNFARFYRAFYDTAIQWCFELFRHQDDQQYVDQALQYMEATKALVLLEEFAEKRAEQSRTLKYRQKYDELEEKLNAEPNPEAQLAISDSIFYWLQQEENDSLIYANESQIAIPNYNDFKNEPEVVYLNYYQHEDTSLSIVGIGGRKFLFSRLEGKNWYHRTREKLEYIRRYSRGQATTEKGQDEYLFEQLLPLEHGEMPPNLVFVPDGILSYFPFEVLKDQEGQYLMVNSDISYSFSLAMKDQMQHYPSIQGRSMIIAPRFNEEVELKMHIPSERNIRLSALEFNRKEASDIIPYMKGSRLFINGDATVANFFSYCKESPIIHIATHAIASEENDQRAQILFDQSQESNTIYLSEIYNYKIPANMVVMSACQTAVGTYEPGEGVMSFARAFTAAGSKSVIASLWAVNDQSTAEIMTAFYRHLKSGLRKDESLKQAKLDYLDHADPEFRDPYFWAGFIAIGDMSALDQGHSFVFGIFASLVLSVLIGLGIFYVLKWRKEIRH